MSDFSRSTTGRLIALSFGIALVGSGAATIIGLPAATALLSVSLFVPITITLFALVQALSEHWLEAVLSAIFLPLVLFGYAVGVGVLATYRPGAGYPLIMLGLGAFALALRSAKGTAAVSMRTAQQH